MTGLLGCNEDEYPLLHCLQQLRIQVVMRPTLPTQTFPTLSHHLDIMTHRAFSLTGKYTQGEIQCEIHTRFTNSRSNSPLWKSVFGEN